MVAYVFQVGGQTSKRPHHEHAQALLYLCVCRRLNHEASSRLLPRYNQNTPQIPFSESDAKKFASCINSSAPGYLKRQ